MFFYFDYSNLSSQTAVDVIRALLKQLVYQLDTIPGDVLRAYKESTKMGGQPKTKAFIELFLTCSRLFSKVYIFLDAYDECLERERSLLALFLQQLNAAQTIFTYVTSREHLRGYLKEIFSKAVDLEIRAAPQDVKEYLAQKLAENRSLRNKSDLKKKIVEKISSSAEGMYHSFLAGLTTIRFLLPQLQLEHVLHQVETRKMETALESLPKTLGGAYELVMTRLEQRGSMDLAMKTCSWICNAAQPLNKAELVDLLAVYTGDKELQRESRTDPGDIIEACQGLVTYDEASETWQLTHYTVQQFLVESGRLLPASYLADICLTYISFDNFRQKRSPDYDTHMARVAAYPASVYVARNWGRHVNDAGPPAEMVERVLQTCISETTRNSILEFAGSEHDEDDPKFTLLHFLVRASLGNVCRRILDHEYHSIFTH